MKTQYLVYDDIILINEETIAAHGGNFTPPENTLHPESLHYVIESVSAELFGQPLYPTLADKAAVYMYNIISNHIFTDGNKRTGLEAALLFLRANGHTIDASEFTDRENMRFVDLFDFTIKVASSEFSLDEVREWFARHIIAL